MRGLMTFRPVWRPTMRWAAGRDSADAITGGGRVTRFSAPAGATSGKPPGRECRAAGRWRYDFSSACFVR